MNTTTTQNTVSKIQMIAVAVLMGNPENRGGHGIDQAHVATLAASIKAHGWLPTSVLEVLKTDEGNLIVQAGNHRLAAADSAGLEFVPCVVLEGKKRRNALQQRAANFASNFQKTLSPLEQMEEIEKASLVDGARNKVIAQGFLPGVKGSESTISAMLATAKAMPEWLRTFVAEDRIAFSNAKKIVLDKETTPEILAKLRDELSKVEAGVKWIPILAKSKIKPADLPKSEEITGNATPANQAPSAPSAENPAPASAPENQGISPRSPEVQGAKPTEDGGAVQSPQAATGQPIKIENVGGAKEADLSAIPAPAPTPQAQPPVVPAGEKSGPKNEHTKNWGVRSVPAAIGALGRKLALSKLEELTPWLDSADNIREIDGAAWVKIGAVSSLKG